MTEKSSDRTSSCCELPRCNSAARRRYAIPECVHFWRLEEQFYACCDAGALVQMAGRGTPRRVAAW